jgi:Kdo2-lipid IVA lauroyltransferase/acyltransferase
MAMVYILNALPRKLALMIGGVGGEMWYLVDSRSRQMAEKQLAFALKLSSKDAKIYGRACFQMIAKNLVDVVRMGRWTKEFIEKIVTVEGLEHFDQAYNENKGVIALTGHIGNFELLAAWFGVCHKKKVAVIGRKLYDERFNRVLVAQRQKFNVENIPTVASPLSVMRALSKGAALGVLLDQDSSNVQGYFADFFGKKALTAAGPVVIARKTGAPVVPIAIYRTKDDRFHIRIMQRLQFEWTSDRNSDIIMALTKCNRALEDLIRYDPLQWAWVHNRWRHRPPDEKEVKT